MAAKKRGRPRGSSTATKIANERRTAENNAKRQVLSIVWFAVAVFLMAVIIVPGENAWNGLHNIIFQVNLTIIPKTSVIKDFSKKTVKILKL